MPLTNVILDPESVSPSRRQLKLTGGAIEVDQQGIDWGESAIKAFMAEQLYGEGPSDYRIPNRIVTLPLGIGMGAGGKEAQEEEARKQLQAKVALFQRRGGVLLRQRAGGPPLYADVVNASLTIPDRYGEHGGIEPGASLKLECLPDFYGNEIELDVISGTGQAIGVLKKSGANAVIAGDYPARCRIVITDTSANVQKTVLWGLRSLHYNSASRASLFFDAKDLSPINGATVSNEATAYSGKWVILTAANVQKETWHPFLATDLPSSGALQHAGSYRVWARASAYAGTLVRLAWSLDDATAPQYNAPARVPVLGQYSLLDLGEVRLEEAPLGEHWWRGIVQAYSNGTSGEIAIDRIWLQPIDDGAGKLLGDGDASGSAFYLSAGGALGEKAKGAKQLGTGTAWANETAVTNYHQSATVTLSNATSPSRSLVADTFGFALPSTATIVGIQVAAWSWGTNAYEGFPTLSLRLTKAGVLVGEERVVPNSGGGAYGGGPTDLWGTTWTYSDINNSGFGLAFRLTKSSGLEHESFIEGPAFIKIFYYTSGTAVTTDAALYNGHSSEIRTDGAFRQDPSSASSYVGISTVLGALPRLPPSGLEQTPTELFVKPSRGLPGERDPAKDTLTAQVFYQPCYIGRI